MVDGRLVALPSTPWAPALFYDKQIFQERADSLRAAGLDPSRPPATLEELDRYALALDRWETTGNRRRLLSSGYLPMEPGWWINLTGFWFGTSPINAEGTKVTLDSPQMLATYEWIRSYSARLGKEAMTEFRSGFGGFASPQNPFLTGTVAMVKQGPWMANFIEKLNPSMNRWNMTPQQIERDTGLASVTAGASRGELVKRFGVPVAEGDFERFAGALHDLVIRSDGDKVTQATIERTPPAQRRQFCRWGVVPFPSAVAGLDNVTYGGMDVLVIPRGSKHRREAFEFIAYVNRQDVSEKLNSLHCKISPLKQVSEQFYRFHPNPYIEVFDKVAGSPNARPLPVAPNWPEINDELSIIAERVNLQDGATADIIAAQMSRAQQKLDSKLAIMRLRKESEARP
jgi:ABC-type glycerol-3-phosphate transport system substrate-binding protein